MAKKRELSLACCTAAADVYGAAANSSPELGSSSTMSTLMLESILVSMTRNLAVKICCAVGRGGAVHEEAEKPALELMGGMP